MPVDQEEVFELTKEEKEEIINKHKKLVDEFNAYLPNEKKLSYDADLPKKLEDPTEVKYYRTLEAMQKRIIRQHEIEKEYMKNNPFNRKLLMPRSFVYGLNTEGTDEAKEYNEKLFNEYRNNPEKIFYIRYQKVLEFDPQKLLDVLDDRQKLLDFYMENQEVCQDAFVFSSAMALNDINPDLKEAVKGISKMIESLGYPALVCTRLTTDDCFVFPKMTDEQARLIIEGNPLYMAGDSKYKGKFATMLEDVSSADEIKNAFKVVTDHGYKLGKDFFYRYEALEHDDNTNTTKEISLDDGIKNLKDNGNICVRERAPEDVLGLKRINKVFDNEFSNFWKRKFSENYDKNPFDYNRIKYENRGGFFERLFSRTSPQYNAFISALKEYNDPNSQNYLNKTLLQNTAEDYFEYKTEEGVSFNKMDETSRNRLQLVSAVLKTFRDIEKNGDEVFNEVNNKIAGTDIQPVREPAVSKNEVEDNIISNDFDNNIEKNELENDNKIGL